MKTLRIGFSSTWTISDPQAGKNSMFLKLLDKYRVELVGPREADYLFYTCFTGDHHAEARDEAVKIFFTGENCAPDFNACDYAISFEYLDYGDRHFRLPLYVSYPGAGELETRAPVTRDQLRQRLHFCNFIYSNGRAAEPIRDAFFSALSEARFVHSAGRHLRNTESVDAFAPALGPLERKRRYMRDFRFSLAFENSAHPGYVTEKILDAYLAQTIPVYWGDPRITEEFNPASFVDVRRFASIDAAVAHILALNADEDAMLAILNAPPLLRPDAITRYLSGLRGFFEHIFDQDRDQARRRPRAGFARNLELKRRRDGKGLRRLFKRNRF